MIVQVVKIVAGLVLDHFKSKREEKRAIHERRMQVIANDQEIDLWNTRNAGDSWKDEYWTLILSIPAIGAFFPEWVPRITEGFAALETMPDWYVMSVLASIGASFGYRALITARRDKGKKE